ncbi:MAG: cytochrome P450, partial [Acidimicrobiia bacterium]
MPDLLSPAFYADVEAMHETFRELRSQGPVWRDEPNNLWAVIGQPELIDVERRDDVFCSGLGYRAQHAPGEQDMISLDDPQHNAQRKVVARHFTPKAVQRFEPLLDSIMSDIVDEFIDAGEIEVVDQLAAALPARATAHLIGFPDDQWRLIKSCSERLMRIDGTQDPQVQTEFLGAIMDFAPLLGPICADRRENPKDDLLSVWTHAGFEDQLIVQETGLFISGGAETTRTVIARGLVELAARPDQWEALAEDPSLISGAVEEMIRWVTPLNNFFRTATRPGAVGDTQVDEGGRVILLYPSANRDERIFEDPYTFDIKRNPNPHVSFGFGTHFCLGASLARLELAVMLRHLTRRIRDLEVLD